MEDERSVTVTSGVGAEVRSRTTSAPSSDAGFLGRFPQLVESLNRLGVFMGRTGEAKLAEQLFLQVLGLRGDLIEAHYNLATLLLVQGRIAEAEERLKIALTLAPEMPELLNKLGVVQWGKGEFAQAEKSFRGVLNRLPDGVEALNNLGAVLLDLNRSKESMAYLRRAVLLRPEYVAAINNLGLALLEQGLPREAAEQFQRALQLNPQYGLAHHNLGTALLTLGRPAEALKSERQALLLLPNSGDVFNNMGLILGALGDHERAILAFEKAISLSPQKAEIHLNLSNLKHYRVDDPAWLALAKLAERIEALPSPDQIHLHFALGKAFEDLGQPEQAFHHFLLGNRRKRSQIIYDEDSAIGLFQRMEKVFTRDACPVIEQPVQPEFRPVFVVGMPRSGTTLVEQILASHPQVYGAGEMLTLGHLVSGLPGFPEAFGTMSPEQRRLLGERYLESQRALVPEGLRPTRVVDKMPGNFRFAGLIPLILPEARIISLTRDPVDTCLSCFSKLFQEGCLYSYDLAELGRQYRAYARLMDHWRAFLPPGIMIEVSYEELIRDFPQQVSRMLQHIEVEWDEACLNFHQKKRAVQTASATQVRKPLYQTSINRWRPPGDLLEPLLRGLDR